MWYRKDSSSKIKHYIGRIISYVVFISWTLITVVPLIWMGYSSFKSNEELVRDIYALPHDLLVNRDDVYQVIPKALNVMIPEHIQNDPRERLIIESTEIAPTRRLHVFFLLKEELPPELARLEPGETLTVSQLPKKMQWEIYWKTVFFNYLSALERGNLIGKFFNSVLYAVVSTFFIALFGVMAGFGLSKMNFKKLSFIIGGLIGFGYLISNNSVIVPLFLMLSNLKLTDTHVGIILVYTAFGLPLSVMLATQFIRDLPNSLIESAFIDGAGYFRMFFSIIVPMTVPVITTISIISGLGIWNEFLLVLVMASSELTKSLPVGVYSFSSLTSTQLGWQLAALVIAVLPVMIIYFIFNNKLTQGVVAGAVKG
ncbi:MAG: carbohydrate ABC transporter permease [Treponemataceae bacterium]|nr:carbohydrate ABC transporter permease [Treponemataceae bacterium]